MALKTIHRLKVKGKRISNAFNTKLFKLIYALASDDPEYPSKTGAFDRLLLLVRGSYWMLSEAEGLKQLAFRLYYDKHYGLVKPDTASPNDDADALRLKRWTIYSRITGCIENCDKHLLVVLEDAVLENGADKSYYVDEANVVIARLGLARDEAVPSAIGAEEALKAETELPTVNKSQNAIPRYNGNPHQIRMQEKTGNYSATQKVASVQISRMRFIFPHIKQSTV